MAIWLLSSIKRHTGAWISGASHVIVIAVFVIGMPGMKPKVLQTPDIVTVELLTLAEVTNVKPMKIKPKHKPRPKPKIKKPDISPLPEVKKDIPKPEIIAKPKQAPVIVPPPLKEEVEKPSEVAKKEEIPVEEKPDPLTMDDVFEEIAALETIELEPDEDEVNIDEAFEDIEQDLAHVEGSNYRDDKPLSANEEQVLQGRIKRQIGNHWSILPGAKNAKQTIVEVVLTLASDGKVLARQIKDQQRYHTDPFFRAAADTTLRAIEAASPFRDLPEENYSSWRDMNVTFDPSQMY